MQQLPTVLLKHTSCDDTHFDWMLVDPSDPDGRLWTARCTVPTSMWQRLGTWDLVPIAPHRREFLSYEGPISGDRGTVQRVDEGWFIPEMWTPHRCLIQVAFDAIQERVELIRLSATRWRATCL